MTQSVDVLPKRMFKCEECSKEFTRKTTLRDHEARMHRKEERFSCFVCKKGFYDKSGMRRHLSVHDEATQNRSQFYIFNIENKNRFSQQSFSKKFSSQTLKYHNDGIRQSSGQKLFHSPWSADLTLVEVLLSRGEIWLKNLFAYNAARYFARNKGGGAIVAVISRRRLQPRKMLGRKPWI